MEPKKEEVETSYRVDGPFRLIGKDSLFNAPEGNSSGLYIFSIERHNEYLIEYVGMTSRRFAARLTEHVREYLSGGYKIYDQEKFHMGEREPLWNGRFGSNRQQDISEFLERYTELAPTIMRQLGLCRIFLVAIEDKRIAERMEGAIYELLKGSEFEEVRRFIDHTVRYRPRRAGEEEIKIKLNSDSSFVGLHSEFKI